MLTTSRRRTGSQPGRKGYAQVAYLDQNLNGGWCAPVPALESLIGPPRFTIEDQVIDARKPMTRMVKDILRVGRFRMRMDPYTGHRRLEEVTPDMLRSYVENFQRAKQNGVPFNLGKTHGDPLTGLLHPDDIIQPLDDLVTDGQTLWAVVYVTPDQAEYLENNGRLTSPALAWNWQDGEGRMYPHQVLHVAVTDNPIVPGQRPFVRMSNSTGDQKMGMETTSDGLPFGDVKMLVEGFLELSDMELPSDVNEDTLIPVAKALLLQLQNLGAEQDEEEPSPSGADVNGSSQTQPALDTSPAGSTSAALANTAGATVDPEAEGDDDEEDAPVATNESEQAFVALMNGLYSKIGEVAASVAVLSNRMDAMSGEKAATAKQVYEKKVHALGTAGKLTGKQVTAFLSQGESLQYDVTFLSNFEDVGTTERVAKKAATPRAPRFEGSGVVSDERRAELIGVLAKNAR